MDKAAAIADECDALEEGVQDRGAPVRGREGRDPRRCGPAGQVKAGKGGYDVAVKSGESRAHGLQSLNEGTPSAGGYTVPEEIVTKIIQLRDAKASLIQLGDYTTKKTMSGEETYQKRSSRAGFSKVGEGGKIPATGTPEFGRIAWKIEKYAGYMTITNELLDDSDENLVSVINAWFADNSA